MNRESHVHAPGHLGDMFLEAFEYAVKESSFVQQFTDEFIENHLWDESEVNELKTVPMETRAQWLLTQLRHCTDQLPGMYANLVDEPIETYRDAVKLVETWD